MWCECEDAPYLVGFLNLLYQGVGYLMIPIQIISQAWSIVIGFFGIFRGIDLAAVIELIVIVYFGGTVVDWAQTGDYGAMFGFVGRVWGVANTMLYWSYWFVKAILDAVMGLIP